MQRCPPVLGTGAWLRTVPEEYAREIRTAKNGRVMQGSPAICVPGLYVCTLPDEEMYEFHMPAY
jgi:hypothetical protein